MEGKHDKPEIKERISSGKVRTIVAMLLLVFALGFLLLQIDALYYPRMVSNNKIVNEISKKGRGILEVSTDTVFEQVFTAREKSIFQFHMYFWNKQYYKTNGKVEITLLDAKSNELATTSLATNEFRHNNEVTFAFVGGNADSNTLRVIKAENSTKETWRGGIKVVPGEEYTIRMSITGIMPEDDFRIYTTKPKKGNTEYLMINGERAEDTLLLSSIVYGKFALKVLVGLLATILLTAIFVLIPFSFKFKVMPWCMLAIAPVLCYWESCKIAGYGTKAAIKAIFTEIGVANMLLLLGVELLLFVVFNSGSVAAALTTIAMYALLSVSYMLIIFRDAPLRATDFSDIGTAMDVAGNYSVFVEKPFLLITIISLCFVAACISAKRLKSKRPLLSRAIALAVAIVCFAIVLIFVQNPEKKSEYKLWINAFYPTRTYKEIGYPLAFAISFKDIRIPKPEGYDKNIVKETAEEYVSDQGTDTATVSEQTPNIIAIMNEAFADLSALGEIKTNEEYLPYFNSITENAVRGTMYASVYGGGTANSEFEFLTSNTCAFLKSKTAYTTLIKKDRPSLARTLKAQGYEGIVSFHPGKKDSYRRNSVYPHMGFEKYIAAEDLENPKLLRQYVSDVGDYETVISEYENFRKNQDKTSPFFMFNVTIQNHGAFGYSTGLVDAGIEIEDPEISEMVQTEQFLNLMKESDEAFKTITDYFKGIDEPTVIIMFGDHQPRVEDEFYDEMESRMGESVSYAEKRSKRCKVPFIIWANYDIEEESDVQIGANALAPYLLNKLNLKMTGYDKFVLDTRKYYPVINSKVLISAEGEINTTNADNLDEYENSDILRLYQYIEYNNMRDSERVEEFFSLKE